jgi:hypothetical protein
MYTQVTLLGLMFHSIAYTRGTAANFNDITFHKRELAVNTLCKVKPVNTNLCNTRFVAG